MTLSEALDIYVTNQGGASKYLDLSKPEEISMLVAPIMKSKKGKVAKLPIEIILLRDVKEWVVNFDEEPYYFLVSINDQENKTAKATYFREVLVKILNEEKLNEVEQGIKKQYTRLQEQAKLRPVNYVEELVIPERLYIEYADVFDFEEFKAMLEEVILAIDIPKEFEQSPLNYIEEHIGRLFVAGN